MGKLKRWQEEMFCREYVHDLNGGKAAIRAGYAPDSGRKDSAWSRSAKLMKRPHVKARIAELMKARIHRLELDSDDIVNVLERGAHVDIRDFYRRVRYRGSERLADDAEELPGDREVSELIPPHELTEAQSLAITGIKVDRYGRMTYLLAREGMLQLLMRHRGMLNDKMTHSFDLSKLSEEELDKLESIVDKAADA